MVIRNKQMEEYRNRTKSQGHNSTSEDLLQRYWNASARMGGSRGVIDIDKAWERVQGSLGYPGTIRMMRPYRFYLRVAAVITLLLALGITGIFLPSLLRDKELIVTTSESVAGKEVILPDGSHVWLNRNSTISYLPRFRGETRSIHVTGEVFLDVVPNALKPFIVDAGTATVRVTGTAFNLRNNMQTEEVEVFVESGSVLLSIPSGENLMLEPGFIGRASANQLQKTLNENRNYMAWKTGLLVYEDASLENVLVDLGNAYGINVIAEDPVILNYRITSTFDHDPAETIINVICITFNMRYVKEGENYRLLPK